MNTDSLAAAVAHNLREFGVAVEESSESCLRVGIPVSTGRLEATVVLHDTEGAVAPPGGGTPPVIVAQRHIPAGLGQRYRAAGVAYVDSGGNAWLSFPGFGVHVQGCRPAYDLRAGKERPSRAFRSAGLRVVFTLLISPHLATGTVRELAAASTVSVGASQAALQDLAAEGFLHRGQDGTRTLQSQDRLTRRWVSGYVTELRPRLTAVDLIGPPPEWWMERHDRKVDPAAQLGGETALALLGYGIRPLTATLYGDAPWHDLRRAGRLTRGDDANVTLRQRFWSRDTEAGDGLAPRLLIYADAVASDDPRQLEVAEQMRRDDEEFRRLTNSS